MTDTIWAGIIGGLIALIGVFLTNLHQSNIYKKQENNETNAVIKAILSELKALQEILKIEFEPKLFDDSPTYDWTYTLGTDYFTIYHSNANNIGKIMDDELRGHIIQVYVLSKFFLDSLKINNEQLEERARLEQEQDNIIVDSKIAPIHINIAQKNELALEKINTDLKHSKEINILPVYERINTLLKEIFIEYNL